MVDEFMQAAIEEAEQGLREGGIPIGSVLVHRGRIIGRGHNRRVQQGSAILHGEMDALENAGRQPASVYRESVIYTTLSPCAMCSGAILLYGIPQGRRRREPDVRRRGGVAASRGACRSKCFRTRVHRASCRVSSRRIRSCGTRTSAWHDGSICIQRFSEPHLPARFAGQTAEADLTRRCWRRRAEQDYGQRYNRIGPARLQSGSRCKLI